MVTLLNKRRILIIVMSGLIVIGIIAVITLHKTPEEEVRQTLDELADTVALKDELSDIERVGLMRRISAFFSSNCRIQSERFSVDERVSDKEIAAMVVQQLRRVIPVKVRFTDMQVTVESDREAQATFTVYAEGDSSRGKWREAGELRCRLKKSEESDWQITEVQHVQVLE